MFSYHWNQQNTLPKTNMTIEKKSNHLSRCISYQKRWCSIAMLVYWRVYIYPGIPTTIKTMGVNITTIIYLRVFIIEIGSTIILMVVEAQGIYISIL